MMCGGRDGKYKRMVKSIVSESCTKLTFHINMWRLATRVARMQQKQLPGRHVVASGSLFSDSNGAKSVSSRSFSRGVGGGLGDATEESMEYQATGTEKKQQANPSASEMEFYSQLARDFDDDEEDAHDEEAKIDSERRRKQEEIQHELDTRTGRGWTDPWEISQEQWMSTQTADDLKDWAPEFVSRISQERVSVHPDGIPTLAAIARLPLPPPTCQHPGTGKTKEYAAYRKKYHYQYVAKRVNELAKSRVERIMKLSTWEEKQDAVDDLFESVEEQLRNQEEIVGAHPEFGSWVERAIEQYLSRAQSGEIEGNVKKTDQKTMDEEAQPVFMDCFSSAEPDAMVPSTLNPLKPHPKDGPGRMVEEWELAAHKKTKRILLRQCTRSIAQTLVENESSRIFIHGRQGTGKSAVLASVVASARKSDYLVMYLPDGDRLRKNGYFVTPNAQREGMYDLQDLSQEVCSEFAAIHGNDIDGMTSDKETMERYFKDTQLSKVTGYSGDEMALKDLLNFAAEKKNYAPMCYSVIVDTLMKQTEKPFLMVLDEFNCYYASGHYFHRTYDEDVREAVPYSKINLFEHAMEVMCLSTDVDDDQPRSPKKVARGGVVVAVTDSHAVPRKVTAALTEFAETRSKSDDSLTVVEVPHFSSIEVDHVLSNFEATGVGKLRLDRGDTVMNEEEVAYLKMVSGSIGQKLLDVSVLP